MMIITEAEAAAIRALLEQHGEQSAAVERIVAAVPLE
jgi:hypothetical protein